MHIILSRMNKAIIVAMFGVIVVNSFMIEQNLGQMLEKGDNITDQMAMSISQMISEASNKCTNISQYSCFSQIVDMKIEEKYGKSWNVHVFNGQTLSLKGSQHSKGQWISFIKEGSKPETEFAYYIYKPTQCSRLLNSSSVYDSLGQKTSNQQYWGNKMSKTLQQRVKALIEQAASKLPTMEENAEYIKNKMGPGKWDVIIWDSKSMDYFDCCVFESYFGVLINFTAGQHSWSYYIGRMSRL